MQTLSDDHLIQYELHELISEHSQASILMRISLDGLNENYIYSEEMIWLEQH
jgi:hypothetical protein